MITKKTIRDVDVYIEGEGKETIVMIHGWPDTYRLWDEQVENLKKKFVCVRFTLPGFDITKKRKLYTVPELIDIFSEIIDTVSPDKKVTLLLHDWGCVFGYQYYMKHKDRVSKLIGIDIGDVDSKNLDLPFKMVLFAVSYQLWLACAWLIGGKVGDGMTRWLARKFKIRADINLIWSGMNYGYHIKYSSAFRGKKMSPTLFDPTTPMLFLYGKNKPTMFHSRNFVYKINTAPGSRAVGFDAGHWVMLDKPAEVSEEINSWLGEKSESEPKKAKTKKTAPKKAPAKTSEKKAVKKPAAKKAKKK
jgi:pimeloyl-ACP methyl ester carboxylesterase